MWDILIVIYLLVFVFLYFVNKSLVDDKDSKINEWSDDNE